VHKNTADQKTKDDHRFRDRELAMHPNITRDFLNGMAVGTGGLLAGPMARSTGWNANIPSFGSGSAGYYPPALTGMRSSHPGTFEVAHALRDGTFWEKAGKPVETGEKFDLIVVATASAVWRQPTSIASRRAVARILILDNHDDLAHTPGETSFT
jgi:spermidine dehydrogenase